MTDLAQLSTAKVFSLAVNKLGPAYRYLRPNSSRSNIQRIQEALEGANHVLESAFPQDTAIEVSQKGPASSPMDPKPLKTLMKNIVGFFDNGFKANVERLLAIPEIAMRTFQAFGSDADVAKACKQLQANSLRIGQLVLASIATSGRQSEAKFKEIGEIALEFARKMVDRTIDDTHIRIPRSHQRKHEDKPILDCFTLYTASRLLNAVALPSDNYEDLRAAQSDFGTKTNLALTKFDALHNLEMPSAAFFRQ